MSRLENKIGLGQNDGNTVYYDGTQGLPHDLDVLSKMSQEAALAGNVQLLLQIAQHSIEVASNLREMVDGAYEEDASYQHRPDTVQIPKDCGVYKFSFGDMEFVYNPDIGEIVDNQKNNVRFSRKENLILYQLAFNGQMVSRRDFIINTVWSGELVKNTTNVLNVMVSRIRVSLDKLRPGLGDTVSTIWGVGLLWDLPDLKRSETEKGGDVQAGLDLEMIERMRNAFRDAVSAGDAEVLEEIFEELVAMVAKK